MIGLIATLIMALAWLGYETDWMRVRLLVGPSLSRLDCWAREFNMRFNPPLNDRPNYPKPKPTGYRVLRQLKKEPSFYALYDIYLSPGTDALVSKQWLDDHWADLIDYQPRFELAHNGVKYDMTIKDPTAIKRVVTALRAKPGRAYPKISYSRNKNGGLKFSPMIPRAV